MDCHESYMVVLCPKDEEFFKPIWLARALLEPNFVPTCPHFWKIQVSSLWEECGHPPSLHWMGHQKSFKWTVDSRFSLIWVDTYAMFIAWKPRIKEKYHINIPTKDMKFAKDNLSRMNVSRIVD